MKVCNCILAGTKACETCYNGFSNNNYSWSKTTTTTINIPTSEIKTFKKGEYKELLKEIIKILKENDD